MRRISTSTKVVDKFGTGKHGFTNGNAAGGVASTDMEDVWFDHVQEEIANVIEATGAALDSSNRAQLLAAIQSLQSALVQATAGSAGSTSFRNKLLNSAAQVAIQTTSPTLSTSPQYGPVEMVAGWASGGAITAGTLTQDTAAPVGRSGKAVRFQSCTLTGAGQLSWRYRMEAGDAVNLKTRPSRSRSRSGTTLVRRSTTRWC